MTVAVSNNSHNFPEGDFGYKNGKNIRQNKELTHGRIKKKE